MSPGSRTRSSAGRRAFGAGADGEVAVDDDRPARRAACRRRRRRSTRPAPSCRAGCSRAPRRGPLRWRVMHCAEQGDLVGVFLAAHRGQGADDGRGVGVAGAVVDAQARAGRVDVAEQGELPRPLAGRLAVVPRDDRAFPRRGPRGGVAGRRLSCSSLAWPSWRSSSTPPKPALRLIGSTWKLARYIRWIGSARRTWSPSGQGPSRSQNRCRRCRHPSAVSVMCVSLV